MLPFFEYGSIPASSAAVETNFNILKNTIFSNHTLPIRLNDFLLIHIKSKEEDNVQQNMCVLECAKFLSMLFNRKLPDPNGGHKCIICSVPVHALQECSLSAPGSEEGFGQKRFADCVQKRMIQKK